MLTSHHLFSKTLLIKVIKSTLVGSLNLGEYIKKVSFRFRKFTKSFICTNLKIAVLWFFCHMICCVTDSTLKTVYEIRRVTNIFAHILTNSKKMNILYSAYILVAEMLRHDANFWNPKMEIYRVTYIESHDNWYTRNSSFNKSNQRK